MMEDQIKQMMNAMESMQAQLVMTEAALAEARGASTQTQKTTGKDPEEYESRKGPGWIFSVGQNAYTNPEDILIDSGAATSVCAEHRGLTQPKGRGIALISATGQCFDTLGATAMVLDCVGGASVES